MDSNSTPLPTSPAPTPNGSPLPPSPPPSNVPTDSAGTPTRWYQETINNLLGRINPPPSPNPAASPVASQDSSTSPDRPSSASSESEGNRATQPSQRPTQPSQEGNNLDPQLDENGFPQNDEYLASRGLTLSELNQEYVSLQDEYQGFLAALADPQQQQRVLAEFNRQISSQRAQFPTAPGQPNQPGQGDYQQAFNRFASGVNPPDGSMLQAANQIPPEMMAAGILNNLAEYLPPQY